MAAKTFASLRKLNEMPEKKDEREEKTKSAGVDSPLPSDADELDDADENTRNIEGNADSMETTAFKPVYKKQEDGTYTLNTEEFIYEQRQIQENVIDDLKKIVTKHQAARVKLQDGTSLTVDATTANVILQVQGALNKNNQVKMAAMLAKNKAGFAKMAGFAMKQTGIAKSGGLQGPSSGPIGGSR